MGKNQKGNQSHNDPANPYQHAGSIMGHSSIYGNPYMSMPPNSVQQQPHLHPTQIMQPQIQPQIQVVQPTPMQQQMQQGNTHQGAQAYQEPRFPNQFSSPVAATAMRHEAASVARSMSVGQEECHRFSSGQSGVEVANPISMPPTQMLEFNHTLSYEEYLPHAFEITNPIFSHKFIVKQMANAEEKIRPLHIQSFAADPPFSLGNWSYFMDKSRAYMAFDSWYSSFLDVWMRSNGWKVSWVNKMLTMVNPVTKRYDWSHRYLDGCCPLGGVPFPNPVMRHLIELANFYIPELDKLEQSIGRDLTRANLPAAITVVLRNECLMVQRACYISRMALSLCNVEAEWLKTQFLPLPEKPGLTYKVMPRGSRTKFERPMPYLVGQFLLGMLMRNGTIPTSADFLSMGDLSKAVPSLGGDSRPTDNITVGEVFASAGDGIFAIGEPKARTAPPVPPRRLNNINQKTTSKNHKKVKPSQSLTPSSSCESLYSLVSDSEGDIAVKEAKKVTKKDTPEKKVDKKDDKKEEVVKDAKQEEVNEQPKKPKRAISFRKKKKVVKE